MDAWWVPLIQQDVTREGSRVLAEGNHSPMVAHHDPAPAEEMQTLSESLQASTVFVQRGIQSLFQVCFAVLLSFTAPLIAGC